MERLWSPAFFGAEGRTRRIRAIDIDGAGVTTDSDGSFVPN